MKNKYQEALNNLDNIICELSCELKQDYELYTRETDYEKYIYILQELVDQTTPKKPKRDRLFYNCRNGECDKAFIYYCPVCNSSNVESMKYCYECGQALDWSDKDE